MSAFTPMRSFALHNRFSFTCPIFGAETEIRMCFHLRDLLWKGQKQPVRLGCQACMHDSKCPVVQIVRDSIRTGEDPDYFSTEKKHGALKIEILEKIRNVIVQDRTMNVYGVPESERKAIYETNGFNAKLKGRADIGGKLGELPDLRQAKKLVTVAAPVKDVTTAAITGDLGAAISNLVEGVAA